MTFYIFHRHRVCLVDCVNLICSLSSWWEGFGPSSLVTLPLAHLWICPLGFAPEAALEDLGLPLRGPGVEVVQLLGLQGFWWHHVLRGVGWGSRRYSALEGYGNQYWPIHLSMPA